MFQAMMLFRNPKAHLKPLIRGLQQQRVNDLKRKELQRTKKNGDLSVWEFYNAQQIANSKQKTNNESNI